MKRPRRSDAQQPVAPSSAAVRLEKLPKRPKGVTTHRLPHIRDLLGRFPPAAAKSRSLCPSVKREAEQHFLIYIPAAPGEQLQPRCLMKA